MFVRQLVVSFFLHIAHGEAEGENSSMRTWTCVFFFDEFGWGGWVATLWTMVFRYYCVSAKERRKRLEIKKTIF